MFADPSMRVLKVRGFFRVRRKTNRRWAVVFFFLEEEEILSSGEKLRRARAAEINRFSSGNFDDLIF